MIKGVNLETKLEDKFDKECGHLDLNLDLTLVPDQPTTTGLTKGIGYQQFVAPGPVFKHITRYAFLYFACICCMIFFSLPTIVETGV
jgi:hypothetical protein